MTVTPNLLKPVHPLSPVAPRGRLGLLALSTDILMEEDLRRFLFSDVQIFTAQIKSIHPLSAALSAFKALSVRRVSVLTPYIQEVNRSLADCFIDQGLDVLSIAGFGFEDDTVMSFIDPEGIVSAAYKSLDKRAEALFISCTALRASQIIERLERVLGLPVISSNQAVAWHAQRLLGLEDDLEGFDRLMSCAVSWKRNARREQPKNKDLEPAAQIH